MATFLSRLEWIKNKGQGDKQVIDYKTINIRLSSEMKNNQMTINLSNDFDSLTGRTYNDNLGKLIFQIDDKFKFYAKYDSDNSGLDLSDNSPDLIFFSDLREIGSEVEDKSMIPLLCTDRTFNVLNRIGWCNYKADGLDSQGNQTEKTFGQGWTAPLMVQDVIQQRAGTNRTPKSSNEGIYDNEGHILPSDNPSTESLLIDARLVSQTNTKDGVTAYGFIQDDRSMTLKNKILNETGTSADVNITRVPAIGTADSVASLFPSVPIATRNYNFPFKSFSMVAKPIYEMLQNLSQIDMTNTEDELDPANTSFNLIIQRAMRYHLDEKNRLHWFYPIDNTFGEGLNTDSTDKVGNDLDLVMGTTTNFEIKRHKLKFALYEVINFIYFEAGTDMNGDSILGFRYDPTSGAPTIKDSRRSYPRISQDMKQQDELSPDNPRGHITFDSTKKSGYAFASSTLYPFSPLWNSNVTVNNDAEYNTQFKNEARRRGNRKADSIIRGTSSQRWKGTIETRFHNFTVNDLLRYTSQAGGIYREKLRITEVNHNIQKAGAFTTLSVEADGKELKA